MYHYLSPRPEGGFPAPDLRMGLVGGAITTAALRRSVEEAFGAPLLDAYGSTETCGSITINWPTGARVEGSCGLPVPGLAVRVVDQRTGLDVPAGAEGEVWVRGPNVMVGYHNQPEATAEACGTAGTTPATSPAATRTAISPSPAGSRNSSSAAGRTSIRCEVEDVLRTVPGVADVAVAGKPHDILGEVPVAFVVPAPEGFDPAEVLAAAGSGCRTSRCPRSCTRSIDPRTASGKIKRRDLLRNAGPSVRHEQSVLQSLFRLDWVPLSSVPAPPAQGRRWAVVGSDAPGPAGELARDVPRSCPRGSRGQRA